jgi:hypothetical protein
MTALASSDVTVSINPSDRNILGRIKMNAGTIAFGDGALTYPFGGIEMPAIGSFGMNKEMTNLQILDSADGLVYKYDQTNRKIRVFAPAPPVVFEETVTVTNNVGTLRYPAAFIMYVGSSNAGYKVIPGGLVPVTGTVAVSTFAAGVRPTLTFLGGDSVASCSVTYVTQAWKEIFDNIVYAKMTAGVRVIGHADLTFTAATPDTIDLGELAVAIQTIMWDDNATYKACKALYLGEDPATTECAVDFSNASGDTRLSFREEDTVDAATDSIYCTYIRKPASGFVADRFVEEDDLTPSTDVVTLSSGGVCSNALLFGTAGDFPGPTTGFANLIRSAGAVGAAATLIQATKLCIYENTFTLGSDHADTAHLKPSYLYGEITEIPGLVPLEIIDGTIISATTLRAMVWGR